MLIIIKSIIIWLVGAAGVLGTIVPSVMAGVEHRNRLVKPLGKTKKK
jgi:hypothetical protein